MGVALGGADVAVAEDLLDSGQRHAAMDEDGGTGHAGTVKGEVLPVVQPPVALPLALSLSAPSGESTMRGSSAEPALPSLRHTTWPKSGRRPSVTIVTIYIRRSV